jgi:hypothetical protein
VVGGEEGWRQEEEEMSKLTKKQRDELPLSDFADPERRLFPILDQDDVDSAAKLLGKAKNPAKVKARIIAIAKRKGLKVPDAWKETAKHSAGGAMNRSVAVFDLESGGRYVDGEWAIYPQALLFEAGEYEDKDFAMTPEELWAAVEQFEPVDGNVEHTDFLKGRACRVRSIKLDEQDSTRLRGEVALPLWLDEQLSERERRLSCEWDRETKTLAGLGLVVHPRIPEASLMAAYAAFARPQHKTLTGQRHLQLLHDMSVERGAVCAPGDAAKMAAFASKGESRAIQEVHDLTSKHGAQCETMNADGPSFPPLLYKKEKRRMPDLKAVFHGLFSALEESEQPPPTPDPAPQPTPAPTPTPQPQPQPVPQPLFNVSGGAATPPVASALTIGNVTTTPDPRIAELERQIAERDATIAKEMEQRIQREAALFAEEMVRAQKAAPSESEKLTSAFAQAMRDDQRHEAVTFGEGEQKVTTSRVQQLRDVYEARPAGVLTQQLLPDGQNGQQLAATFNQQTTPRVGPDGKPVEGELSPERRRKLLEASSLGRTIVRDESKNGNGQRG